MKSFLNYLDEVEDGKLIVALEGARDNLKKALAHQQGQLNIRSNDIKSPQEILMVAKRKHQANKSWSLQKNLRVHLINPPINEPWRTEKDYIEDREAFAELQKQALEAHERSVEAHEILKKSYRNQTISLVVVTLTLVATIIATATGVIEFVVSQK
ncbi:hypothetical protein EC575_21840 [Vibrio cholerae]|nr:hypothetical protein EC575_21840 [Vibrio cholerae]